MHISPRKSILVNIGNLPLGGDNPIRLQSMTNVSTMDTEGCIRQCIRIAEAGGDYVRLTAQGVREAENLRNIKDGLRKAGYNIPLIADIHFNPKAAETAAAIVEKVRINPGNYADPARTFKHLEYSDEEYTSELLRIRERFIPLLAICKQHKTAIRIGVNHGSLSDRIMSRYGDTPQGMVESCMEFLRICVAENFFDVVISIKASNTSVMVTTVRLLASRMDAEGMAFPLHLGVTEAGEGEDGRIRSAVGIGALLLDGLGDTIRVSLSEAPEDEIPVARLLVDYATRFYSNNIETKKFTPLLSDQNQPPIVVSDRSQTTDYSVDSQFVPDIVYKGDNDGAFAVLSCAELSENRIANLKTQPDAIVLLHAEDNNVYEQKNAIASLREANVYNRIVLWNRYNESDLSVFQVKAATDCGSFFLGYWADGLMLSNSNPAISPQTIDACSFNILQATGRRISKTEYISCPGCGRTLFDLQTAIQKVKAATSHLKGLKIAIMGCIVNGPGEMADADFGYVGAGKGNVSLYQGKKCLFKNIPEAEATDKLVNLIKKSQK